MKKIDKNNCLSTQYQEWLSQTKNDTINYKDQKLKKKWYQDVLMSLLACQGGLCAYTEKRLCEVNRLEAQHWKNGKYNGDPKVAEGEIDHFHPKSKGKIKNEWDWDNLFVIWEKANKHKGKNEVYDVMKPDTSHYTPHSLLSYDVDLHRFFPAKDLATDLQKRKEVEEMISTLGLNIERLIDCRRKVLKRALTSLRDDMFEPTDLDEFPTAFQMLRQQIEAKP